MPPLSQLQEFPPIRSILCQMLLVKLFRISCWQTCMFLQPYLNTQCISALNLLYIILICIPHIWWIVNSLRAEIEFPCVPNQPGFPSTHIHLPVLFIFSHSFLCKRKRWPGGAEQWIGCCISKYKRTFVDGTWAEVGGDGGQPTWSPLIFGEGNGNPLQCSCLENPKDGGAWWAAVCGVAWSRTRLKRLSSSSSSSRLPWTSLVAHQ